MEHAFGTGEPFSVGIEEELLLVDPAAEHRLAAVAESLIPSLRLPEGAAGFEAYAGEVELRSPPSRTSREAVAAIRAARAAVRAAGGTALGAGVHPAGDLGDARLVDHERYHRVGRELRGLLQRTPECALHVHVGMPDAETAIRAFNGLRTHLPLLAGLAANSPFWFGRDSGMASARAALVRAYPGRGVPRAFRDFADYERTVESTLRAAGMEDRTQLWWDVRPHAQLGTLEVREMDAQAGLDDVAALTGLVHCLARHEAERSVALDAPSAALSWSTFRAARDGLEAEILDEDGRVRPLREIARETLGRLVMVAGELDELEALDGVERILGEGGAAARQRDEHARAGMPGLLGFLAERTAAG
jgi:carboxylate-amine ligase